MARGWKRVVERALVAGGTARIRGRVEAPRSVVLAYHNIVPSGERAAGDRSLHIDQQAFADQLDWLLDHASITTLDDAVASRAPEDRDLRVAITFDDAYRGTMTAGVAELARRSLPCVVFVPTGLLGAEGFWWDLLADPHDGLDASMRDVALRDLRGDGEAIVAWARERGRKPLDLPPHAGPVDDAELLSSDLHPGLSFGAHTVHHVNLAASSEDQVRAELDGSRQWLASRSDRYVDWVAYPYGLWSPTVAACAATRFEGALRVDGGAAMRRGRLTSGPHETPRVNVPRGLTLEGLALRLYGVA